VSDSDVDGATAAGAPRGASPPTQVQRADIILGTLFILLAIYSLVLLPFSPSQVGTHTVLWEALQGSTASVVTGGALADTGHASVAGVVAAGLVGTIAFDWMYWWGGRRWGQWWINMLVAGRPRTAWVMERIQRGISRWGIPLMLVSRVPPMPAPLVFVAAGWSGMSLRRFLVLDVIAGLLRVGLFVTLGYVIGPPAVHLAKQIAHYGLALGILIVAVIVFQFWRSRRGGSAAPERAG